MFFVCGRWLYKSNFYFCKENRIIQKQFTDVYIYIYSFTFINIYIYIYNIYIYIYIHMYMYTICMYVMYSFWLVLFLTILVKSGEKVTSSYEPTGHWQKCFFLSIRFCETRKDSPGVPNGQMFVWLHTIWWYMFSWPLFIY